MRISSSISRIAGHPEYVGVTVTLHAVTGNLRIADDPEFHDTDDRDLGIHDDIQDRVHIVPRRWCSACIAVSLFTRTRGASRLPRCTGVRTRHDLHFRQHMAEVLGVSAMASTASHRTVVGDVQRGARKHIGHHRVPQRAHRIRDQR